MEKLNIQQNIKLSNYTTLRLGGLARYFASVHTQSDIEKYVDFASSKKLLVFPLGGGSNIIVSDNPHNIFVVKMENKDIEILSEDTQSVRIRVGAGYIWDDFVEFTVQKGLSGIEALSAIPGTCGATPVQNVGAYGAEVSGVIESVHVYSIEDKKFEDISRNDCQFGYRDSIFKRALKGKCLIESVVYRLSRSLPQVSTYPRVMETVAEIQLQYPHDSLVMSIRRAIQKIRADKLPDPIVIANVGSFFKNVFVSEEQSRELLQKFPGMPQFPTEDKIKLPSGWLIEKTGLKGYIQGNVAVYAKNALVLVNNSATHTEEIMGLANTIQKSVSELFGVQLEIEPEILY